MFINIIRDLFEVFIRFLTEGEDTNLLFPSKPGAELFFQPGAFLFAERIRREVRLKGTGMTASLPGRKRATTRCW